MRKIWLEEAGLISMEWMLLLVVTVIGIVGGMAIIRDAVIVEAGETSAAIISMEDSYTVSAPYQLSLTNAKTAGGGTASISSATVTGFEHVSKVSTASIEISGD